MSKLLVKTLSGEHAYDSESQVRDAFLSGKVRGGDLVQAVSGGGWIYVSDLPLVASFFATKPSGAVESAANFVFVPGQRAYQAGPFTVSELKARIARGEFAPASWVSLEGTGQWRQLRDVAALKEAVPPLPGSASAPVVPPAPELVSDSTMGEPSVKLDLKDAMELDLGNQTAVPTPLPVAPLPSAHDEIEREDPTLAISILGLNAEPAPVPVAAPPIPRVTPPKAEKEEEATYDGITAEIPVDPIWLVKQGASENVVGPFRFLEIVDFLKKGKLNKSDKISKVGTNRFQKIAQQYEFNVSYSLETVVRDGVEVQRISIQRRHPRVAYIANVQITRQGQVIAGRCVNISAGGVMVELPKAELQIGEALQLKILPDIIARQISCGVLVTGKIAKIPPGFALQFETLSKEDKEAIEFFVNEALKREQAGKQTAV